MISMEELFWSATVDVRDFLCACVNIARTCEMQTATKATVSSCYGKHTVAVCYMME